MNAEISLWPNKFFYKNQMIALSKQNRKTLFKPYTVFQVNTIEDIEIQFLKLLLQQCFEVNKHMKCTYGIICGDPSSRTQIEDMLKYVTGLHSFYIHKFICQIKTFHYFQIECQIQ